MKLHPLLPSGFAVTAALLCNTFVSLAPARAASHTDAPSQVLDPSVNITDVYAFNTAGDTVTLAMNVYPLIDPDFGPIHPFFSPDVLYELHIKNNATFANGNANFTGAAQISYQFRFSPPAFQNPNTTLAFGRGQGLDAGPIQRVGDARQNFIQTMSVTRVDLGTGARTPLEEANRPMIIPPPNMGPKATPLYNDANGFALPGATTDAGLDQYTRDATYNLGGNRRVFAGLREEGFYIDQGGIFDLLNIRNPGIDTMQGLNVLSIVLQVPKTDLVATGTSAVPIIGVYATSSRRTFTLRRPTTAEGRNQTFSAGSFTTVSRMGNPLLNEVFVAVSKKDRFNQTRPGAGDDAEFRTFAENPEIAVLLNAVAFKSSTPTTGPIQTTGRTDLSAIFIPDLLKLDTSTPAVRLAGQEGFNRLSVFGGDTVQSPFQGKAVASGFPNGRRFGDDVVDIGLTAVGSVGTLPPGTVIADNVNGNDVTYPTVFPFQGVPHSGFNHRHHGQPAPAQAMSTQGAQPLQSDPQTRRNGYRSDLRRN